MTYFKLLDMAITNKNLFVKDILTLSKTQFRELSKRVFNISGGKIMRI
jgi:hypothetical protein